MSIENVVTTAARTKALTFTVPVHFYLHVELYHEPLDTGMDSYHD